MNTVAERTSARLRKQPKDAMPHIESKALIKAARDETDKFVWLYNEKQEKTKAALESSTLLKTQVEGNQTMKGQLKKR